MSLITLWQKNLLKNMYCLMEALFGQILIASF